MRQSLSNVWLPAGLLAGALALGCNHCQRTNSSAALPVSTMLGKQPASEQVLPPAAGAAVADGAAAAGPELPIASVPKEEETPRPLFGAVMLSDPDEHRAEHKEATAATAPELATLPAGKDNDCQLTGKIEPGDEPATWAIRLSQASQREQCSDRLILVAPNPLAFLQAGQTVRLLGKVVDLGPKKAFQVKHVQVESVP